MLRSALLVLVSFGFLVPAALSQGAPPQGVGAQGGGTGPAPGSRESMWPAPTAEDWKKPVPIRWQRTFDDALRVSEETNRPILVCVNMDGEIASEHYAGIRYRQPEIAKLYEPYVCVIASVYRHNPRDYDEEGNRIPCPRFGTVTCGEHIALEPIVYEKFLDEVRVAPRHIMVELDRSETYDVYYAFDTQSVFDTIERGMSERDVPVTDLPADLPLLDRVASPDSGDRAAVEDAYRGADRPTRVAILERAIAAGDGAPVDVLRLAVHDADAELARLARRALLEATSEGAIDLIARALRTPMPDEDRAALIGALERLGERYPRAKTLAVVFRGLAAEGGTVDVRTLSTALLEAGELRPARREAVARVTEIDRELGERPDDPEAKLDLAEATLSIAKDPATEPRFRHLSFEDVRNAAREAERMGAYGWRANATLAIAEYRLGNLDEAYRRAETAITSMPAAAAGEHSAEVLAIFGEARRMAITRAVQAEEEWPAQWLQDVNEAYAFLVDHPEGTERNVQRHYDFLVWLGAKDRAAEVLERALERFGDSGVLHDRLRTRLLRTVGPLALERHYEDWVAREPERPSLAWFAAYASMVTAEYHRRFGDHAASDDAYERAAAGFRRWGASVADGDVLPEDVAHFAAMAHAGRARNALEVGDLDRAWDELGRSFDAREASAANLDGLNISAVATTQMLAARADAAGRTDLAEAVRAKLASLDPVLLEPAPFDRNTGGPTGFPAGRPNGRPGRRGGR